MAYFHLVMGFSNPIAGSFVDGKVRVRATIQEDFIPGGPEITNELKLIKVSRPTKSYIEGLPLEQQVLLEFEEPFNNAKGDITVEYISGLYGNYFEPVLPFTHTFTPTAMPFRPVPRALETVPLGENHSLRIDYIESTSNTYKDTDIARIQRLTVNDSTVQIELNYVGQIKP